MQLYGESPAAGGLAVLSLKLQIVYYACSSWSF